EVADLHGRVRGWEVVAEVMLEHPDRAEAQLREELAIRHHPLVELVVAGTGGSRGCYDAADFDSLVTCHSRPPVGLWSEYCAIHCDRQDPASPLVQLRSPSAQVDHDRCRQARYPLACLYGPGSPAAWVSLARQNAKVE